MHPFQEYNSQTQRVLHSVQAYGEFMIRYREVGCRDLRFAAALCYRIQSAVANGKIREWYFEEYCYSVHFTSEQDICYLAVSEYLDKVDWEVVKGVLSGYLLAFQEVAA